MNLISGYIEKIGLEDSFWTTKINGEKIKGAKYLKNHNEAATAILDFMFNEIEVREIKNYLIIEIKNHLQDKKINNYKTKTD